MLIDAPVECPVSVVRVGFGDSTAFAIRFSDAVLLEQRRSSRLTMNVSSQHV